ncbi:hypothetical protein FOZ62_021427, partial [Perkinsus olseni]
SYSETVGPMTSQRPRPPTCITEDEVDMSKIKTVEDLLTQLEAAVHRRKVYLIRSEMKPMEAEEAEEADDHYRRVASPSETTATAASEGSLKKVERRKKGLSRKRKDASEVRSRSDSYN